jgi:hypothetical protein
LSQACKRKLFLQSALIATKKGKLVVYEGQNLAHEK